MTKPNGTAEIEDSILGSALVDRASVAALPEALPYLRASLRSIAEAMLRLDAAGADPTDLVALHAEVGRKRWAELNANQLLATLIEGRARGANLPWLIARLRTAAHERDAGATLELARDALAGGETGSAAVLIEAARRSLDTRTETGIAMLDLAAILTQPSIDPPWIYPRWLAAGDRLVIGAQAGFGKSYLLLDLALALATGQQFLGIANTAEPQRVVIVDEENPRIQDERRLQHLMRGRDIGVEQARTLPLRVAVSQGLRLGTDTIGTLRRELDREPPQWLMLDSLVRFLNGHDESESGDMSEWFATVLDPLRTDYGCGIVVLAHVRKPPAGPLRDRSDPLHTIRGSGDIGAWPDAVWVGLRDGKQRTLEPAKSRWLVESAMPQKIVLDLHEGQLDGLADGASRLVAAAEDTSCESFVGGRLTLTAEVGVLRKDLVEDYAAAENCSEKNADRAVSRALARMRRRGQIREETEPGSRAKRLFLAR